MFKKGTVVGYLEQASIVGIVIQYGKMITGKNYLNTMMKPWLECVKLKIIWMNYNKKLRSVILSITKIKLDRNFHGPFRVYEVTETNTKVKQLQVTNLGIESRTISL